MIINSSGYDEPGSRLTLLWTNPNPTAEFKANSVAEFDRGDYKVLYVLCLASTTNLQLDTSIIINNVEFHAGLVGQSVRVRYGAVRASRIVTLIDNGLSFSTANYESMSKTGSITTGTGTKFAIPYKIYGGV